MEDYACARGRTLLQDLVRLNLKSTRARALSHPMLEILGGLAVVAVILFEGHQVIHGQQTAGTFVSFVASVLLAYEPLKRLAQLNAHLQEGVAAAMRVFELLDRPNKLREGTQTLMVTAGNIVFDDVSFAYPSRPTQPALSHITLQAQKGQKIGIVGPSGSGKSTLVNLFLRFFDPDQGQILIDDQPLTHLTFASLRDAIALVSQDIVLFDDTIAANIAQGRPGASMAEIEEAAHRAHAHAFITSFPQGYQTWVGQNGTQLSGGQRQRLAIARAILKNAPILVLDEATSALDLTSEKAIRATLAELSRGPTTLVITHRLDTLRDADWIYVLVDGQIVQSGSFSQLEQHAGAFKKLLEAQSVGAAGNLPGVPSSQPISGQPSKVDTP